MKISKYLTIIAFCALSLVAQAQIGMRELGDSLTTWTGFSSRWSASVKVKNLRVNDDKVTVRTNFVLKEVRWTPENVAELKRKVSLWVLGHEHGEVTILTGKKSDENIESLITDCAKGTHVTGQTKDLTDRHIALCPSHGLYYNRDREEWIWQRATLWTTVEDLYSQEYVRLIKRMLENSGATVYMPRADVTQQELGVSGMPQWTEAARYWLINQGVQAKIWDLFDGNEYKDDMKCRGLWVNSLKAPIDLCLALHTDGIDSENDSTIVGTLAIYTAKDDDGKSTLRDGRDRETTNRNLADYIQTQVTEDLQRIVPEWTRRQLKEANYCESRVPVVPSLILELLSHKNMADMRYGLDPRFRFTASRAVYKGILRYLSGNNAVIQPLPIHDLGINAEGLLQWKPTIDEAEPTAKPTYYMVYIQENEGEWNVQQVDKRTQLSLSLKRGVKYNFYVVAGNDGGLSFPSPIVSAYLTEQKDAPMVLVVDAFDDAYGVDWFADSTYAGIVPGSYACEDYFTCAYIGQQWNYTRKDEWVNDDNCGWGSCYRDHTGELIVGNTHDWCAQHGRVLRRMRISYVSCTANMIEMERGTEVPEYDFTLIDVICGRQRNPINETLANALEIYMDQVGKVLLSTDHFSAIDPEWASRYLHAQYYAGKATHSGRVTTPRHRMYQLVLEPNPDQIFTCHPEGLKAVGDSTVRMATYEDMRCPAAIGFGHHTLVYGFPLEAMMDFDKIYRHSIEWLLE